jgi:16S rRNA (uracil1498-N3)-methyltransferase
MVAPRFFVDLSLHDGQQLALPDNAARHVQVLRLQPGAALTLFNGRGGEWPATVQRMGRHDVEVRLGTRDDAQRELPWRITLALGVPANERMDALVEKATELGVAAIQPLQCERSVLRLKDERAAKKVAHWQAVAVAACEQSGRTLVPQLLPVCSLAEWLTALPSAGDAGGARLLLSLRAAALPLHQLAPRGEVVCLSGPEGGLADTEEAAAIAHGFQPVSLGARVLRADTAPLAVLAHLALRDSRVT